jgi:hypothetical protein
LFWGFKFCFYFLRSAKIPAKGHYFLYVMAGMRAVSMGNGQESVILHNKRIHLSQQVAGSPLPSSWDCGFGARFSPKDLFQQGN